MSKVSVVIPSRNERWLRKTILDVLGKSEGSVEVVVTLDGYWPPKSEIVDDDRVTYIHKGEAEGMRQGINSAVAASTGDWILKLDAHCMLSKGWDVKLKSICQPNWVVTPLRSRLDPIKWEEQIQSDPRRKPKISFSYLSYPEDEADWGGPGLNGKIDTKKILDNEHRGEFVDDLASAQGSAWFMARSFFNELKLMDHVNWGPFWQESAEIIFSAVLRAGGASKIYTGVEYSHYHKGAKKEVEIDGKIEEIGGRGYSMRESWLKQGRDQAMRFFAGEKVWTDQKFPLSHLIEMHMPMPTWDDDKLERLKERERANGWNV